MASSSDDDLWLCQAEELFLGHLMHVDKAPLKGSPDGVAIRYLRRVFGSPVEAYHWAIETQGRGGLHAHMHVWLLHSLRAKVVDQRTSNVAL